MNGSKSDRLFPRVRTDISCSIQILAPEETFSPFQFEGAILDISQAGIGLAVPDMPQSVYSVLLRGKQYARVSADLPGADGETRIFGRIVWLDYRDEAGGSLCRVGVAIEQNPPQVLEQFKNAVITLSNRSDSDAGKQDGNNETPADAETATLSSIRPDSAT